MDRSPERSISVTSIRRRHHTALAKHRPIVARTRSALRQLEGFPVVLGLDPRTYSRLKDGVPYYVYILASRRRGTLYVGVTNDLVRRVHEHRSGAVPGFASRYGAKRLVWFETHDDVTAAIRREKNLKHWVRAWKITLIEGTNPEWSDVYDDIAS